MDITTLTTNIRQTFRRGWRQFIMADLIFRILSYILLVPTVSWVLQSLVRVTGSSAVSNTDIISFLLSPVGIAALLIVGALTIAIVYIEQVGLFAVAYANHEDRQIDWKQVLNLKWQYAIALVGLGGVIILTILGLVLPVVAIGGGLFLANLTTYDINYYLQTFPPEMIQTILIITPLIIGLLIVLAYLYVAWAFALPGVLFSQIPYQQALKRSRELVKGNWWPIAQRILGWALGWILFSLLVQVVLGWLGSLILNLVQGSLQLLAVTMGILLILNATVSVVLGFIGLVGAILINFYLYQDLTKQKQIPISFPLTEQRDETVTPQWQVSRKLAWASIGGALLVATLIGVGLLENIDESETVLITAHRGSSEVAPPNTLAAVQAAIDDGADYAEIDVQETADGIIILNHDQDFMLAAGNPLAVHEATYEQVQMLDVGSSFSPEFAGEPVPTLAEALDLAQGKIKVNIELKYYGQDQKLAERVIDVVRAADMSQDVLIMSLDYDSTQEVKQLAPDIPVGFLASAFTVGDLTKLNVDFLAVSSGLASTTFIDNTHDAGKQVFVWTLNDRDRISEFIGLGVDSIITDRPEIVHEVLAERATMRDVERLLLQFSYQFD